MARKVSKARMRARGARKARRKKAKPRVVAEDTVFITSRIQRFLHWYTFGMFFITLVTGVLIFYKLNIIPTENGMKPMLAIHAGFGVAFFAGMLIMGLRWVPVALLWRKVDFEWWSVLGGYMRKYSPVPPAGRLNGGQKAWVLAFWLLATVSFLSGAVLWLMQTPMQAKITFDTHRLAMSLHAMTYALMSFLVLWHFYFTTVATPGSWGAMWGGKVARSWAVRHHPLWFEKRKDSASLSEEKERRRREKELERKKSRIASAKVGAASSRRVALEKEKQSEIPAEEPVPEEEVEMDETDGQEYGYEDEEYDDEAGGLDEQIEEEDYDLEENEDYDDEEEKD